MAAEEFDFKLERYEEYYGDIRQVKKIMDECKICGAKLVLTHLSDFKNLMIQESARCPDCGNNGRHILHILN